MENNILPKPEILAPAGDSECFLAALAAGADAIYLGMKQFSARMEAENFGFSQLARLIDLAHGHNRKVYIAINTLLKPNELEQAWRMLRRLTIQTPADGIIFQDLALLDLAKQSGFQGMLALSTLANVSFPAALEQAARMGANRVILPRELSLDEMKLMGEACPANLELECFIHGALCYCISGRCYWSSYLGGKSSLRGRCVQPCRRKYTSLSNGKISPKDTGQRFFSCQDLEIGVLAKTLLKVPHLVSWKIEGRKKGPHYVYHTVTAYRILRDYPDDSRMKAMALEILEQALGRTGVKANFLSQRPVQPMQPGQQTSSGLLAGKISFNQKGECQLRPHFPLLPKDYLRIGVEDERWHKTLPVRRSIPKRGVLTITVDRHNTPKTGTPVFLIDRREPELEKTLADWQERLGKFPERTLQNIKGNLKLPKAAKNKILPDMLVYHGISQPKKSNNIKKQHMDAFWLSNSCLKLPKNLLCKSAFWLPPDIWPNNQNKIENMVASLLKAGAKVFICNAPWQRGLFNKILQQDVSLIAGPFCNTCNAMAINSLAKAGFSAAFVSQELAKEDLLALPKQSCLPLGLVLKGFFPAGVSRFGLNGIKSGEIFLSPKGEHFWTEEYDGATWIFPGWHLDLSGKQKELANAGYSFFATLIENAPKHLPQIKRQGLFNWDGQLL